MCGEVRRERSHHSQSNTLVNLGLSPPITVDPRSWIRIPGLSPLEAGAGLSRSRRSRSSPIRRQLDQSETRFPSRRPNTYNVSFELSFCFSLLLLLCCHYQLSHWTTFQPIREDYSQLAGTESWCLGCKCDPPASKRKKCAKLWCLWSLHFHKNT